jgi:hypothetical protein
MYLSLVLCNGAGIILWRRRYIITAAAAHCDGGGDTSRWWYMVMAAVRHYVSGSGDNVTAVVAPYMTMVECISGGAAVIVL